MGNKVKIVKVSRIDIEAEEADIIFLQGDRTYNAFGCPIAVEENSLYEAEFSYLEDTQLSLDVIFSENKEKAKSLVKNNKSKWSYYAYGRIVSVTPTVVDCGGITLELNEDLIKEEFVGKYIYFDIGRLDII